MQQRAKFRFRRVLAILAIPVGVALVAAATFPWYATARVGRGRDPGTSIRMRLSRDLAEEADQARAAGNYAEAERGYKKALAWARGTELVPPGRPAGRSAATRR